LILDKNLIESNGLMLFQRSTTGVIVHNLDEIDENQQYFTENGSSIERCNERILFCTSSGKKYVIDMNTKEIVFETILMQTFQKPFYFEKDEICILLPEIWIRIMFFCDDRTLTYLSMACTYMYDLSWDDTVWEERFKESVDQKSFSVIYGHKNFRMDYVDNIYFNNISSKWIKNSTDQDIDIVKVCILGSTKNTGKTTFVNTFINGTSTNVKPTSGVDFYTAISKHDDPALKMQIWDISGDKVIQLLSLYVRSTKAVILMYDITSRESYTFIHELYSKLLLIPSSETILVTLLGNKLDKGTDRVVSFDEANNWAKEKSIYYNELCAYNEAVVHKFFYFLIQKIRSMYFK